MTVKVNNRELQSLIRYAEAKGWDVTPTTSHIRFTSPEGVIVGTSKTPSDWRTFRNTVAQLRRAGLEIPHKVSKAKSKLKAAETMIVPGVASFSEFDLPTYPHLIAIIGQWRDSSWFDETGQPLSEEQWDVVSDNWLAQKLMAIWMEVDKSANVPPRRKFSMWAYGAKYWYLGSALDDDDQPDESRIPNKCTCGKDFKVSTHSVMALASHIVEHHEICSYDHEPVGVGEYLFPWTDPAELAAVLDTGAEDEIARLEAVIEAQRGWLDIERQKVEKVKNRLREALGDL